MVNTLKFQLVSPEATLYDGVASMVLLPGALGEIGVLPNHAPMVLSLNPGVITVYSHDDDISQRIFVSGGFANINETGCTVMADEGINVNDIEPHKLELYIQDLRDQMHAALDQEEQDNIKKNVVIAQAKIDLFKKLRNSKST